MTRPPSSLDLARLSPARRSTASRITIGDLLLFAVGVALALSLTLPSPAAASLQLDLEPLATGLDDVVAMAHADDDRLFLVSKEGRVLIFRDGAVEPTPYLDIRDRVFYTGEPESEQGLLTVAFHPDYQQNGFLFAAYTAQNGDGVLARFSVSGPNSDQASKGSERILLRIPQPGPNHNINRLAFGLDGYLYLGSGDGGYRPEPLCTPQQPETLLGKLLRIDVDQNLDTAPYYAVPADNPFVAASEFRPEIWALGLRNPWRFSFDEVSGDLFLADVGHRNAGGEQAREEINVVDPTAAGPAAAEGATGGYNFGFKRMAGFTCRGSDAGCPLEIPPCFDPAYTQPVLDYGHDATRCAVIGGQVYRGTQIPSLVGAYVFGDYCGATATMRLEGGSYRAVDTATVLPDLISIDAGPDGELLLLHGRGTLSKLVGAFEAGAIGFVEPAIRVPESVTEATLVVERRGATQSAAQVDWRTEDGTARAGLDYLAASGTLSWEAGDTSTRTIRVLLRDDGFDETDETFSVVLSGDASATALVTLSDDDLATVCTPSDEILCARDGRFAVSVEWRDFTDRRGPGTLVPGATSDEAGLFWFFQQNNYELVVKVLDGCALNERFWVYSAATTDVEYTLRVLDTRTGTEVTYQNPLGRAAPAITDTDAFSTCP